MAEDLSNKNCFITGATGGIGRCIVKKLAEKKCNLFLTSLDAEGLRGLKEELVSLHRESIKVSYEPGDFNRVEDIEKIINRAKGVMGRVDVFVNCAGVFEPKLLKEAELRDFEDCFNVNIKAPFLFCKAFAESMKEQNWGRIVNLGSSSAYEGFKESSIYCASKHAILGLSRSLQEELREYGVRTICVSPSAVKTEMGRKIKSHDYNTFIDPEEVAEYIVFAISFNKEMVSDEIRLNRMNKK